MLPSPSIPGSEAQPSASGPASSAGFVRVEAESAEGGVLSSEEGEETHGLGTDGLSHLRSPSVMEVREKGYGRLKEELSRAQRVRLRPRRIPACGAVLSVWRVSVYTPLITQHVQLFIGQCTFGTEIHIITPSPPTTT